MRSSTSAPIVPTNVIEQLNDHCIDILLISLWFYATGQATGPAAENQDPRDAQGFLPMRIAAFLDARGLVPITKGHQGQWRAGHRVHDKQQVLNALQLLSTLSIELQLARTRATPMRAHGAYPALMLAVDPAQKEIPVVVRLRPGDWWELTSTGQATRVVALDRWVLRFDQRRERWEKRLALYLIWCAATTTRRDRVIVQTIDRLLTETGLWQYFPARTPGRGRHRFEIALSTLVRLGILRFWSYSDEKGTLLADAGAALATKWGGRTWSGLSVAVALPAPSCLPPAKMAKMQGTSPQRDGE